MLLVAHGVEGFLAGKTFNRLGRLLDSIDEVTEDTAALDLHQSGSVVHVDGDTSRDTTRITQQST